MQFLKQDDLAKLLLRLSVGGLMFFHGVAKVGSDSAIVMIKGLLMLKGLPDWVVYGVFVGELIAPVFMVLGIHSRMAGLVMAVNMMFAVYLAHMGDLFELSTHGGWRLELQAFYLVGGLVVMFLGSGKFAVKPD